MSNAFDFLSANWPMIVSVLVAIGAGKLIGGAAEHALDVVKNRIVASKSKVDDALLPVIAAMRATIIDLEDGKLDGAVVAQAKQNVDALGAHHDGITKIGLAIRK